MPRGGWYEIAAGYALPPTPLPKLEDVMGLLNRDAWTGNPTRGRWNISKELPIQAAGGQYPITCEGHYWRRVQLRSGR